MAGNINAWEKDQVKFIDKLINECRLRYFGFERGYEELCRDDIDDAVRNATKKSLEQLVPQSLRYFATDLYSALDYLCYLCHCHYNNNGQPSDESKARNVNFPYKNLQKSDVARKEDICRRKNERFIQDRFQTIFGRSTDQRLFDGFREIIEKCQLLTWVDGQGNPCQQQYPETDQPLKPEDANDFNTLHFLRNHGIHRKLTDVAIKPGKLYVNLKDDWHVITAKDGDITKDNNPEWQSFDLDQRDCWVTIPSAVLNREKSIPESLRSVAIRLISFVIRIRDRLLQLAFGSITEFEGERVKKESNGVHIDDIHYPWNDFDRSRYSCCNNTDNLLPI